MALCIDLLVKSVDGPVDFECRVRTLAENRQGLGSRITKETDRSWREGRGRRCGTTTSSSSSSSSVVFVMLSSNWKSVRTFVSRFEFDELSSSS